MTSDEPLFVSIPRAAARIGLSASTVRRMVKAGELPTVWIRRRLMVPTRPLHEWAEEQIARGFFCEPEAASSPEIRTTGTAGRVIEVHDERPSRLQH